MNDEISEKLREAYESIEKWDLTPSTVVCSVCGCVFKLDKFPKNFPETENEPCTHLKKLFSDVCNSPSGEGDYQVINKFKAVLDL